MRPQIFYKKIVLCKVKIVWENKKIVRELGVLYANHKVTKLPRFPPPQKFSARRRC